MRLLQAVCALSVARKDFSPSSTFALRKPMSFLLLPFQFLKDTESTAASGSGTVPSRYSSSSDISMTSIIFWDHFGQLSLERLSLVNWSSLESVENIPLEMMRAVMGITTTVGGTTVAGELEVPFGWDYSGRCSLAICV